MGAMASGWDRWIGETSEGKHVVRDSYLVFSSFVRRRTVDDNFVFHGSLVDGSI